VNVVGSVVVVGKNVVTLFVGTLDCTFVFVFSFSLALSLSLSLALALALTLTLTFVFVVGTCRVGDTTSASSGSHRPSGILGCDEFVFQHRSGKIPSHCHSPPVHSQFTLGIQARTSNVQPV